MKQLQPMLIFPETEPAPNDMASLLTFFDSLSYYLPTEPQDPADKDAGFLTHLCTGYAPAPLGNDLVRFNQLLREMETSRPEEFSRLFSAAAAPVATGQVRDRDETSAGRVYSALQTDSETKTDIQYKERLWQARLVLKLAEMLDRKENEVRLGLQRISSVEQNVFASLDGQNEAEPDDPAGFVRQPENNLQARDIPQGTSALLLPQRAKAWAELYKADRSEQRGSLLISMNPDSGAMLLDGYENIRHRQPVELFSLTIPAFNGLENNPAASDTYLANRDSLHTAAKDNLHHFSNVLVKAAETGDSTDEQLIEPAALATHISAWEEQVKLAFPGNSASLKNLTFHSLPGISIAELLEHRFGVQPLTPQNRRQSLSGILAIVTS